ncbi:MAG: CRTAC1 family protein [Acidobacteriota bacterium]
MGTLRNLLLISVILSGLLVGCDRAAQKSSETEATESPQISARESHERMLDVLEGIRQSTATQNHWLGDAAARELERELALLDAGSDPARRYPLLTRVAENHLRLGEERQAIDRFEEAIALASRFGPSFPADRLAELHFRTGVAYFRFGETANCATRHVAESCILPIRGDAIHTDPAGSRGAIRYLGLVLDAVPRTEPLHIKAVWLYNLAHMTLGEYPSGVPADFRLPEEIFSSESDFQPLRNVAPERGIASFNLSGGAAIDDFDGDGHFDLFTTTFDAGGEPRFFHGGGDGTFEDRTAEANLEGLYGGLNLIHADVDNDGDNDVFVLRGAWLAAEGCQPNSLLLNDGKGRFTDVTFAAGLAEPAYPTQTAAWADFDGDGWLDLFVGNEHGESPPGYEAEGQNFEAPSQLFRNRGDGTFEEVASRAGIALKAFVKGSVWGDIDADGDPDLYVSVLGGANRLYVNRGDGTFIEKADELGVAGPRNSFPVWFWDFDNDGRLDLYVPSYRGSVDGVALVAATYFGMSVPYDMPALYRGTEGGFQDVAQSMGLDTLHLPMGSNFGDLDGDGRLDFYLGTGYPDYEGLMPNVMYHNLGDRFSDVTIAAGLGHLQKGHAVVFADIDEDGDLDLFSQMGGAFPGDKFSDALFENPGSGYRFLELRLEGTQSNRSAIGARVRVELTDKGRGRTLFRTVGTGGSFGSNPLPLTIGLGSATSIDAVEVAWPSGEVQRQSGWELDGSYTWVEGEEAREAGG